ncbi:hypothetical protein [Prosthecobacter sp.]|uniref:hypothetical protein n=1 Tax=Prosthecobacter sp. TaxID=1965333 RepID=UPI0037841B95
MAWFQLDPQSIATRARAAGSPVPTLGESVTRGIVGFTLVSVAGFVPWAAFGKWFTVYLGRSGNVGMYAACAVVFLALTAPLLHRLIIGPGSVSRFYKVFGLSFTAYSIAWIIGWMSLGGHAGSIAGLASGTILMSLMLVAAFDALRSALKVFLSLFLLNSLGYFIGGVSEHFLMPVHKLAAMLSWGVFYGIGLGAGLGIAFHLCQERARRLLKGA